jgi:hypothetical protein
VFTRDEREQVRQMVYAEMVRIEAAVEHNAGSYTYLCQVMGSPAFCHSPVGPVLRYIPPK